MAIKPKAVLDTLHQRHNGVLRFEGTDCAIKLLRSMRMRDGLVGELRERLRAMADAGQIVIECEGNRFDLIAVPTALENTDDGTKDGDQPMIAPAGQRMTTSPRDGEGHPLPAYLGPQHVGPLTITRKSPAGDKADEAVAAAAELVCDEIVKSGKLRYGRDELLAIIQAHLQPLYDGKEEVALAMAVPVLKHLQCSGHANLVPVPSRRGEFVIEIVPPAPAEAEEPQAAAPVPKDFDPIAVLAVLAPELEAARLRLAELEELAENAVSPEVVARLTEKAEGFQAEAENLRREKQGLQQELDDAAAEKEKILNAQKERLAKVRADHQSALATLGKERERALAAVGKKLEAALAENALLKEQAAQKSTLPDDLKRRVEKLLGN